MDILIKNMEMPLDEKHSVVLVFGKDGFEEARDSYSALKIEGITAVALPSHGRLGDLDALKNSVADMRMEKPLRNGAKQVIEIGELFGRIIDDAPVIVEATE